MRCKHGLLSGALALAGRRAALAHRAAGCSASHALRGVSHVKEGAGAQVLLWGYLCRLGRDFAAASRLVYGFTCRGRRMTDT